MGQNHKSYQQESTKKTDTQQAGEIRRGAEIRDIYDRSRPVIKLSTQPSKRAHSCILYILEVSQGVRQVHTQGLAQAGSGDSCQVHRGAEGSVNAGDVTTEKVSSSSKVSIYQRMNLKGV